MKKQFNFIPMQFHVIPKITVFIPIELFAITTLTCSINVSKTAILALTSREISQKHTEEKLWHWFSC